MVCRPLPTRPSHYVGGVLQPLRAFLDADAGKCLQPSAQQELAQVSCLICLVLMPDPLYEQKNMKSKNSWHKFQCLDAQISVLATWPDRPEHVRSLEKLTPSQGLEFEILQDISVNSVCGSGWGGEGG